MLANTNNQTDLLPIVIEGQTFKPNEDGMWNLNEIAKTLNVREPGQWRNAVQAALIKDANLHVSHGNGTLATEEGAIAYAMWVSTDFYLMVIRAFIAMRNSAVRELRHKDALLDANMPKATTLDMKARGAGLTWTEACRVAGIQQPRLALEFLAKGTMFVHVCDDLVAVLVRSDQSSKVSHQAPLWRSHRTSATVKAGGSNPVALTGCVQILRPSTSA